MNPDEFARLQQLFEAARSLDDEAARDLAVRETEPGELRNRLLAMLAIESTSVGEIVEDALTSDDASGRTIGPYELMEQVGSGGMGAVYKARRREADYEQTVAVKLLHAHVAPELRGRLAQERRVLAQLRHPNIAVFIDGGETERGEPYVVMEYIDGAALLDAVSSMTPAEVVNTFVQLCNAVQYAHQRLIVHRDIKPDNVLIDQHGTPKLLDFGIAGLIDESGRSVARTQTVAHIMTPAYASPEQVRGEGVTTASDIYSLGVMLYECLCGQKPYDLSGLSLLEIEALLTTRRPEPPTTVLRETRRTGKVTRDLDWIVMQAMHADPTQRYGSTGALADDLRAYLAGEPVAARPDTPGYRLRKLVQRHPYGALASGAFVLLLAAATVVLSVQAQRLTEQRDRAEREATTAAAVSDFMVALFQSSDPLASREPEVSAQELLRRGAGRIQEQLRDAPEVQARLLSLTAQSYANLGRYEEGLPLLERAVALRRGMGESARNDLAESLNRLGNYRRDMGNLDAARELIGESVAIRESLTEGRNDFDLADSYNNYGLLLYDAGRYDRAESTLSQSLAMHRAIAGDDHLYVGIALHNLALVSQAIGDYEQAEARARESLQVKAAVSGADHPSYANTLELLSGVARRRGNYVQARELVLQARAIKLAHYPDDHPRVVTNLRNEALIAWDTGELEEAAALFRDALARLDHNPDGRARYRATLRLSAAELALDRNDPAAAATLLRTARPLVVQVFGERHDRYADWLTIRARVAMAQDDPAGAATWLRTARDIYGETLPADSYAALYADRLQAEAAALTGAADCGETDRVAADSQTLPSRQRGAIMASLARCLAYGDETDAAGPARVADALLAETLPPEHPRRRALQRYVNPVVP